MKRVWADAAVEEVVSTITEQFVWAFSSGQGVVVTFAPKEVVTAAAYERVVSFTAKQEIPVVTTINGVGAILTT